MSLLIKLSTCSHTCKNSTSLSFSQTVAEVSSPGQLYLLGNGNCPALHTINLSCVGARIIEGVIQFELTVRLLRSTKILMVFCIHKHCVL